MHHDFLFEPATDLIVVHAYGTATVDGFARLANELVAHAEWSPGKSALWDLRELSLKDLPASQLRVSSEWLAQMADRLGTARFAWLTATEVDFGVARIFEMMTNDRGGVEISVFRSLPAARSWLER